VVANSWLEGTYTELYPHITRDAAGMERLFRQFSFPGGIPSHAAPETPGSIHEGGELGYALAHAYGAVLDNPDLIAACVIGDGEAETGPLAASWHSNKFLNPVTDGAVLPILHLNGYKIANPTVLARIPESELVSLLEGYGHRVHIVAGDDPAPVHQQLAATLDACVREIQAIQRQAREPGDASRPRWPMIVLRTPKGWTGPKTVDGVQIEGTFRAHQVPIGDVRGNPGHLAELEEWMRSYRPAELFGPDGTPVPELAALRRYGFHGLSHSYVSWRAAELAGRDVGTLSTVTCHLGAGASLAAVHGGKSVDTTMGFTPLDGLVMATRSGAVDPGLVLWLEEHAHMPTAELATTLEYRSGLYGLAGTADMRQVLARAAAGDTQAELAREVYLHRLRGSIAAMAAAMGGMDTLVFTGGVGENSAEIRQRAMDGLGFLGVAGEPGSNADGTGDREIGQPGTAARAFVISAREDLEIARQVRAALAAPLHGFLDPGADQPGVDRPGGEEPGDHPDLHKEPEGGAIGPQVVRGGEEHEEHQRHPAEQPDLERGDRRHVGLGRLDEPIARAQAAHRGYREVLEHDPQRDRGDVVGGVLRA
jgi:hypothetical protein